MRLLALVVGRRALAVALLLTGFLATMPASAQYLRGGVGGGALAVRLQEPRDDLNGAGAVVMASGGMALGSDWTLGLRVSGMWVKSPGRRSTEFRIEADDVDGLVNLHAGPSLEWRSSEWTRVGMTAGASGLWLQGSAPRSEHGAAVLLHGGACLPNEAGPRLGAELSVGAPLIDGAGTVAGTWLLMVTVETR